MKKRILKDTIVYSISTFLAKVFGFARSIVVARFLGPSLYGLWNALSIILEYSRYSSAGVLNAMNREIPFYRGKKDEEMVRNIRNTAFSMACVPSLLIGLGLSSAALFLASRVRHEIVFALAAISALVLTAQLYDFFTLLFRSENKFRYLSRIQIFLAALDLVLVSAFVIRFGFYGFLSGLVLSYVILIAYIFRSAGREYRLRLYFDKKTLFYLVRIGIFMTLIVVVVNLRTTVDRLMIAKFLGVTQLGYFGISYVLIQFVFLIPSALSQILYPRLIEKYGEANEDTRALRRYIETATFALAYSMPLLIGETIIFLPFAVKHLLPQYIPGIAAAQITMLGLFFFSTEMMAGNFLVTTNRLRLYLGYSVIAVIVNVILDYIFLRCGFGIEGVALGGIMITSFLYTSLILGHVLFHYLRDAVKTAVYLAKVYLPFLYSAAVLAVLSLFVQDLFVRMALFAASCLPLFWKLEKDTKALSLMLGAVRDGVKRRMAQ